MKEVKFASGLVVTWFNEHCDARGELISRQVSISPPILTCLELGCLWRYIKRSLLCALLMSYHTRRVKYAESHRRKKIPTRYRTGEPQPKSIGGGIAAIIKLKLRR